MCNKDYRIKLNAFIISNCELGFNFYMNISVVFILLKKFKSFKRRLSDASLCQHTIYGSALDLFTYASSRHIGTR